MKDENKDVVLEEVEALLDDLEEELSKLSDDEIDAALEKLEGGNETEI